MIDQKKLVGCLIKGVFALLLSLIAGMTAAQEIGRIQFASGDVRVVRDGQTLPVMANFSLRQSDRLETGEDGQVQTRMVDDVYLALRPRSRLNFDSYRVTRNGQEPGILSLAGGILRTFTSALAPADRVKFRMKAQSATVGIRGSGNILAANDADGVINHTLEGAHSITATDLAGQERTLVSYPGQTVQVLPGTLPRFIPTPAFIVATATTSPAKAEPKSEGGSGSTTTAASDSPPAVASTTAAAATSTTATTVAPPVSVASTNTVVSNLASTQFSPTLQTVVLSRFLIPFAGGGFVGAFPQGGNTGANLTFSADGALLRADHLTFGTFLSGAGAVPAGFTPTTISDARIEYQGGTAIDLARNREGSIALGRWEGGSVVVTDLSNSTSTSYSLGNRSAGWSVFTPTAGAFTASLTGATNYALEVANRPTDAFGNVGQLIAATASLNFSSRLWSAQVQVAINNQNLTSTTTNQAMTLGTSTFGDTQAVVTCSGSNCNSLGYRSTVNGNLTGTTASSLLLEYRISANRVPGQAYADTISGAAALAAVSTPTVGIVLPLTGSLTLPLSTVTFLAPDPFPPTVSGSLSANFSNRTVDLSLTVTDTDPGAQSRHQLTANGLAIQGIGFSASRGASYARAGDGTFVHTCTGSTCNTTNVVGRFDGYFTNSQGTGATVNFGLLDANAGPNDTGFNAIINFGTAPRSANVTTANNSAATSAQGHLVNTANLLNQLARNGCGRCVPR